MSEKNKDQSAVWSGMLTDWERNFNAAANKSMESEQFARMMHQAASAGSNAMAALSEFMQKYLTTLNLPSRADLTNIGERLQVIEAQLRHLTELVHSIGGESAESADAASPRPTRGRKPPSAKVEKAEAPKAASAAGEGS
jgi:hypothetical protein